MYESQTHSKYYRSLEKRFGAHFKIERLYEQIYSKHFKKYYKGEKTKRYAKILNGLEEAENVNHNELIEEMHKV